MSRQTRIVHIRAPRIIKCFVAESRVVKDKGVKTKHSDQAPTAAELEARRANRKARPTRQVWKEIKPTIIPDRANRTGGCTVVFTGDPDDNSGMVEVQVAFCSKHDAFDRKRGRRTAMANDKYVIKVTDIPREMLDIEHQMLTQLSPYLARSGHVVRSAARRSYGELMYRFLPKRKESNNG